MNLLVFNIRTDADHPTQGVTTLWLNKLAERFDRIFVITMHRGRLALRENIEVYSVGGELGHGRLRKAVAFYRLLWGLLREREIHGCLTHMAVLFTLMGGLLLALKRVPTVTWYAHSAMTPVTLGAYILSHAVITASEDSFRIRSPKVHVIGHGIDTDHYRRKRSQGRGGAFLVGSVGRISRIKGYETLLHALKLLVEQGMERFQVVLYGNIQTRDDEVYRDRLERLVKELSLEEKVMFPGPLSSSQVPETVSRFDAFANMLSKGGAGKAVLEAMSMEVPTLICTPAFDRVLSREDRNLLVFDAENPASLKEKLEGLMSLDEQERAALGRRLRGIVLKEHSLDNWASRLKGIIEDLRKGGVRSLNGG